MDYIYGGSIISAKFPDYNICGENVKSAEKFRLKCHDVQKIYRE